MKKVKIIASLLTISLLVACGKGTEESSQSSYDSKVSSETSTVVESSVESLSDSSSEIEHSSEDYSSIESYSSESSEIQESSEEESGWTSDQLSIFENHLYGIVPPYVEMEGVKVLYSEEDDMILIGGIQSSKALIAAWSNALTEDGYYLENSKGTYYYLYSMIVTLDNGEDRNLFIEVTSIDQDGNIVSAGTGTLIISMYDPFTYDWPVDDIAYYMSCVDSNTTAVLPEYDADYYSFNLNYLDSNQFAVYCFTQNEDPEAEYAAILKDAGYDVLGADEKDSYGYRRAFSSDLLVEVLFMYNAKAGQLVIIAEPYIPVVWPEEIDEWIDAFTGASGTRIPQVDGADGYEFHPEYYEDEGLVVLFVYGGSEYLQNLYFALIDAGWNVGNTNTSGIFYAISPLDDLMIQFGYFADYGITQIVIMPYEAPAKDWPTEDIAEYMLAVDPTSDTVLPEFEADEYEFNLNYLSEGMFAIYCYVDSETAEEDYEGTLVAAGWTILGVDGEGYTVALSPDGKIEVAFAYDTSYQDLDIIVGPHVEVPAEWPTEEIQSLVDILTDNSGTVLPGIEGGDSYLVITNYYAQIGYLIIAITTETDLSVAYAEILADAGWRVISHPDEGFFEGISPNEDLYVQFSYDEEYSEFDIYFKDYVVLPNAWPGEDIASYLAYLDLESAYEIPEFEADKYQIDDSVIDSGYLWIYCYVDSDTAEADYAFALATAGWTVSSQRDSSGYYIATSPDEVIDIRFKYDNDYKDLDIGISEHYVVPTEWPTELVTYVVNTMTNNSGTVLPALPNGTGYNFVTNIYEQYGYVVMFVDGDSTLLTDYMSILEHAGYMVIDDTANTGFVVASSSNNDLQVQFIYDEDYSQLLIYIMPIQEPAAWPIDQINAALANIFEDIPEIPAYTAGSEVQVEYVPQYSCVSIFIADSSADDVFTYCYNLYLEGWDVTMDSQYEDSYYVYSPDYTFVMNVYYYNGDAYIDIYRYEQPVGDDWDATAVAEAVANICDNAATIPAYNAGSVLSIDYISSYDVVEIVIGSSSADDVLSYLSSVQAAGWTVTVDPDYIDSYYCDSPDGSIYFNVYAIAGNQVVIDVYAGSYASPIAGSAEWPENDVAELLEGLGIDDVIPAYEGEMLECYTDSSSYYDVVVMIVANGTEDEVVSAYYELLEDAGFTYDHTDSYDCDYYLSANSDLLVGCYVATDGMVVVDLQVKQSQGGSGEIDPNGDPDKTLSENFDDWAELMGYSSLMPNFDLTLVDSITYDIGYDADTPGYCYFDFYLNCDDADMMEIYDAMIIAIENAGYVGSDYGGMCWYDNGEVSIWAECDSGCIYVSIAPAF